MVVDFVHCAIIPLRIIQLRLSCAYLLVFSLILSLIKLPLHRKSITVCYLLEIFIGRLLILVPHLTVGPNIWYQSLVFSILHLATVFLFPSTTLPLSLLKIISGNYNIFKDFSPIEIPRLAASHLPQYNFPRRETPEKSALHYSKSVLK